MKKPIVFGKYLLLDRINVGGMAEVFVAKVLGPEGFERFVAIKRILPTMAEDEEFIKMFIDEARISAQLSHANIVTINELGKHEDSYFIAMEYLAGRDLRALLDKFRKRKQAMPVSQAAFILAKVCDGLDYAHRKRDARGQSLDIIHRDVSPQNVLISYEGEVKLIDFGIAKAANRSQKTQAGILKGKFGYMSPEQVRGQPIDRRTDIFAAGVMLFELLSNEKLFVGDSDYSILEKVRNAEIPPLSRFNPLVPPELEEVVLRALAREPSNRYQWASQLRDDLLKFVDYDGEYFMESTLSAFMKQAFADEILAEAEKLKRYSEIDNPRLSEDSPEQQVEATLRRASSPSVRGLRDSGPIDVSNDAILPLDDDELAGEVEPSQSRKQIVIGDGAQLAGATTVAPRPKEGEHAPVAANETRILSNSASTESRTSQSQSKPIINTRRLSNPKIQKAKSGWVFIVGLSLLGALAAGLYFLIPHHPSGKLVVEVEPPEAQLRVDGKAVRALSELELPEGKHRLTASFREHQDHAADVWIRAKETSRISIALAPIVEEPTPPKPQHEVRAEWATSTVIVFPTNATLTVDGRPVELEEGQTSMRWALNEVYWVTASASGFAPFEAWYVPSAHSDTAEFRIELLPVEAPATKQGSRTKKGIKKTTVFAEGKLLCSTRPAGAEVWVDGRYTGRQTPIGSGQPLELPVGKHKVVFKLAGKQSGPHDVEIRENRPFPLKDITLD